MPSPLQLDDAGDAVRHLLRSQPPRKIKDAAEAIYAGELPGWRMAEELLYRYPDAMARVDQFVGDHGFELGRNLGAGAESLVWEARPRSGGDVNVLKLRVGDATPENFSAGHPSDVPGVVPYLGAEQASPGVAMAFQPKARAVYERGMYSAPFASGAERIKESLLARGIDWGDAHKSNIGAMADGTWGVIDGWVFPAHPDWKRPNISAEEAIRMLRITPDENAAIYGIE